MRAAAENSFTRALNLHGGSVYIVIHRQTVSFYQNFAVWLDTQDARNRDRNPFIYISWGLRSHQYNGFHVTYYIK